MKTRSGIVGRSALVLIFAVIVALSGQARANSLYPPVFGNGIGQFILLEPEEPAPVTPLRGLDGRVASLANFRGKVALLNFWATWCAPCVREMSSLDALAAAFPSSQFVVVAVSLDKDGAQAVKPFVAQHHLEHLTILLDPDHRFGALAGEQAMRDALRVYGLPISYVIDKAGRVAGYLIGPANWDSPEARSFADYFVKLNGRSSP